MSAVSAEAEYAAQVYAETPRDGALTVLLQNAFLAGVRWEKQVKKPRGHPCKVCGERTLGHHYCDEHRYDPCVKCGRQMRRNGQKAADHPGTVARNTLDTCSSCYAKARRGGEYTADLAIDPEHLHTVARMVNARFTGNDLLLIATALGVQGIDTQADIE